MKKIFYTVKELDAAARTIFIDEQKVDPKRAFAVVADVSGDALDEARRVRDTSALTRQYVDRRVSCWRRAYLTHIKRDIIERRGVG